jgi:predicted dehydrogenase
VQLLRYPRIDGSEEVVTARIGVVGCGWWATRAHLPALLANPDAVIAAVADPDEGKRRAAAERFGVEHAYASAREMLAARPLDGVIVATPHREHYPTARAALEHGAHVLVEKPMTIRPEDARALVELALEHDLELLVGYPWHWNAHMLELRAQIAAGAIGTIEHVSCLFASTARDLYRGRVEALREVLGYPMAAPAETTYSDPATAGGGQGQTQLTHSAALLCWLTGLRPRVVTAMTGNFDLAVDLVDTLAVRFDGGALGSLSSTGSLSPGCEDILEYRIFGSEGHILVDPGLSIATISRLGQPPVTLPPLPPETRYLEDAPAANLVELCMGRGVNGSPGELGAQVVELIDAMYRSSERGVAVTI